MNNRKIGAILSYINTLMRIGINFLFIPILIKYIGKYDYGIYNLVLSLMGYFALMDLGLSISVVRFYARLKAINHQEYLSGFLWLTRTVYLVVSTIVLVVGSILYFQLDEMFGMNFSRDQLNTLHSVYIFLLLNTIITLIGAMYQSIVNGSERFIFSKSTTFLQLALQPILAIFIFQFVASATIYAAIIFGINVVIVGSWIWYVYQKLGVKMLHCDLDPILIKEIIKLAGSCFFVLIADQIFFRTNQIVLGILIGAGAVAVYAVAATVYMNYMSLSLALNSVFLPKVSAMVANKVSNSDLSALFIRIGRLQFSVLGLIIIGFFLYGREFIVIWLGDSFIHAYYIALIVMVPFTIDLIQNIGNIILQALNKYYFRAMVLFPLSIFNVLLTVPMASKYGGIGCAISTGIAMFIGNGLVMNYYYAKYIRLDIKGFWLSIINLTRGFIVPTILAYGLKVFYPIHGWVSFMFEATIFFLLYTLSLWLVSLNEYEKSLFVKFIYKFK